MKRLEPWMLLYSFPHIKLSCCSLLFSVCSLFVLYAQLRKKQINPKKRIVWLYTCSTKLLKMHQYQNYQSGDDNTQELQKLFADGCFKTRCLMLIHVWLILISMRHVSCSFFCIRDGSRISDTLHWSVIFTGN